MLIIAMPSFPNCFRNHISQWQRTGGTPLVLRDIRRNLQNVSTVRSGALAQLMSSTTSSSLNIDTAVIHQSFKCYNFGRTCFTGRRSCFSIWLHRSSTQCPVPLSCKGNSARRCICLDIWWMFGWTPLHICFFNFWGCHISDIKSEKHHQKWCIS